MSDTDEAKPCCRDGYDCYSFMSGECKGKVYETIKQELPIQQILSLDQPWPLSDVLNKLIEASEILLKQKGYDGHGWEEIDYAVKRGKEISLLFK